MSSFRIGLCVAIGAAAGIAALLLFLLTRCGDGEGWSRSARSCIESCQISGCV